VPAEPRFPGLAVVSDTAPADWLVRQLWPGVPGSVIINCRRARAAGGRRFRLLLPSMDNEQARARLLAERTEVEGLLRDTERAGQEDRATEDEVAETGDIEDAALSLTAEGQDDSIAETLRERLDALNRALKRLDDGTYGRSVRSGVPIPEERLEADPAAELTIEEARARP
jgi:DnaK suppressor protein